MRRPRKKRIAGVKEPKVDLTSMIDVTFLLLIFFVLNLNFVVPEGMIESFLPKERGLGTAAASVPLEDLRVKLLWTDRQGRETRDLEGFLVVKIGRVEYNAPGDIVGDAEDAPLWPELAKAIGDYSRGYRGPNKKGLPVILDARDQVPHKYVVRTLNEIISAGVSDVTFAKQEAVR